jgi:cytochrome P450
VATDLSSHNLSQPAAEFPYLRAVIKETLRWSHPAPTFFPRITGKDGIMLGDGRHIPAGVEININQHVALRDKGIYGADADMFRPERWLVSNEEVQRMEKYSNVWGYGPSVCLGRPIAEMELAFAARDVSAPGKFHACWM